jgi:hypothetical protein
MKEIFYKAVEQGDREKHGRETDGRRRDLSEPDRPGREEPYQSRKTGKRSYNGENKTWKGKLLFDPLGGIGV